MYQLDSLTYQNSGVSSAVNLLDEEIDAGYGYSTAGRGEFFRGSSAGCGSIFT